jgi:hypothetical protein
MPVNADKPKHWKADVNRSVDFYNDWFMSFAPKAYREQREKQARVVEREMERTDYLRDISPALLKEHPEVLTTLRAATAPPIARDRLVGLAHVKRYFVESMEGATEYEPRVPPRTPEDEAMEKLERLSDVIEELIDEDLCPWKGTGDAPPEEEAERASLVLADRLCGATTDPIIRNAQEKRQKNALREWLEEHGYEHVTSQSVSSVEGMKPGTFTFDYTITVAADTEGETNIPVDGLIMPKEAKADDLPLIVEAKSAGDFVNPNKRRKEEAQKTGQLREEYGQDLEVILFLCGYFDSGYLGYEAAEGLDWVWEHRISDLAAFGLDDGSDGGSAPSGEENSPDDGRGGGTVAEPKGAYAGKEAERLELQEKLDAEKTQEERNRWGQFATPLPLAEEIMQHAERLLPEDGEIDVLEPALGTGAFFSALRRTLPTGRMGRVTGYERDEHYGVPARRFWDETPLDVRIEDFTSAEPPECEQERYDLLVTNPPYARHHHLSRADKHRMQQRAEAITGTRPSGLSGQHAYFLYLAHPWLRTGALAAWLVPGDFMYVNYGRQLRRYLLEHVTLVQVHQFDPADLQFDDALVSSTVLWLRNEAPPDDHEVLFTQGGTHGEPTRGRRVPVETLRALPKWHRLFEEPTAASGEAATVGELFSIKRGLVTGANDFFMMTREEAQARDLPGEFLKPILPSPRHLSEDTVEADPDGRPLVAPELLLLDCSLSEDEVRARYPALWVYLEEGREQELHERYLCSRRSPWYAQEARDPAPLVCPYMGRSSEASDSGPFRFILNQSDAVVANVYLNLYPKPRLLRALREQPSLLENIWETLATRVSTDTFVANGRTYGGGLHKMEPKELENVPVPGLPAEALSERGVQVELFQ